MENSAPISFSVKVRLDSQIRRIPCSGVFSELQQSIAEIFSIPIQSLALQYTDDEGDLVHMSSQAELEEALKFSSNGLLRLTASTSPIIQPTYSRTIEPQPLYPELSIPLAETKQDSAQNEQQEFLNQILKIKLEIAELKGKKQMLKRGKNSRDDLEQWKAAKQELIDRMKRLKSERKNLNRQPLVKQARGNATGKYRARFISTQLKDHSFAPGETFTEVFRVRNEGDSAWPEGTVLMPIGRNADHVLLGSAGRAIPVSAVLPGCCVDIAVPLQAPQAAGKYCGLWRLATRDGCKFGQRLELSMSVCESSVSDSEDDLSETKSAERVPLIDWLGLLDQLQAMGWSDKPKNIRLLRRFNGNLSLVVDHLINSA